MQKVFMIVVLVLFCRAARSCGFSRAARSTDAAGSVRAARSCGFTGDTLPTPYIIVLGTLQDGGSPHLGCTKTCCANLDPGKKVVSLGVVDPKADKRFLIEATPDISSQLKMLNEELSGSGGKAPDGIFLSHAHIGHYAGLMQLGREAMNTKDVPVFVMPKMKAYLENNGPWSQLVGLSNIKLLPITGGSSQRLTPAITITPIQVPHRDEFSETIGLLIHGPYHKVLFIPDIDKWSKWEQKLTETIKDVDVALLDATFFSNAEVGYRNIREIPHPLVTETMDLLDALPETERKKVSFIHLNHTNPLLVPNSPERTLVLSKGYDIAFIGMKIPL